MPIDKLSWLSEQFHRNRTRTFILGAASVVLALSGMWFTGYLEEKGRQAALPQISDDLKQAYQEKLSKLRASSSAEPDKPAVYTKNIHTSRKIKVKELFPKESLEEEDGVIIEEAPAQTDAETLQECGHTRHPKPHYRHNRPL